jgi:hypothetical protein
MESKTPVHEVFIHNDWEKNNIEKEDAIGFLVETKEENDEA